jgi:hypothetical protein
MVASGIASKGLDFNDIQHVIIFSMPKEIEDYVHQIGRTGRSGKTGIATTFVNMNTPEQTLLDLKYLLMEAGQKCVSTELVSGITDSSQCCRVPPFLQTIEDPRAAQGGSLKGCPVCGGGFHFLHSWSANCNALTPSFRSRSRHFQLPKTRGYSATADGFSPDFAGHRRVLNTCTPFICTHLYNVISPRCCFSGKNPLNHGAQLMIVMQLSHFGGAEHSLDLADKCIN